MGKKPAPYVFLISLVVILFFILGFRAGQGVEKTNRDTSLMLSIPPSASPQPTSLPLVFKTYKHPGCGISFLYPNSLSVETESTQEARLSAKELPGISFSCFPQTISGRPTTNPDWITTFQNQQIVRHAGGNGTETFMLRHPVTGRFITVTIQEDLYPLLEKSLEFTVKK